MNQHNEQAAVVAAAEAVVAMRVEYSSNHHGMLVRCTETEWQHHTADSAAGPTAAAQEQLQSLLCRQALSAYRVQDYLLAVSRTNSSSRISSSQLENRKRPTTLTWTLSAKHRCMVGEWFYEVLDHFQYPPPFAATAMHYFDRACTAQNFIVSAPYQLHEIQLLSLVCIYLALKLFYSGPCLSLEHMARMSAGIFTVKQLEEMERRLLVGLNWFVHPPLAHDFLVSYMHLLESRNGGCESTLTMLTTSRPRRNNNKNDDNDDDNNNNKESTLRTMYKLASKAVHRSVLDYYFLESGHDQSVVAMAALLHASQLVFLEDTSSNTTQYETLFHFFDSIPGLCMNWTRVEDCCQRFHFQDTTNNRHSGNHTTKDLPAAMLVTTTTTSNKSRRMDSPLSVVTEATNDELR